ncbi:FapA family protein [Desulfoscipio geothermicus]|uniref:Polymer-forming protein n=1 Tax=Desulfoscipio geothermicus DSM 3669 TaxID=1121426 RepID=A0A1I6DQI7_9FIRM|nr:FapA family protein [Desulfoscipio geothermicus]SFR07696.1 Polymer-forming protein [Desulfoscipio geothermicus DSM 3669]
MQLQNVSADVYVDYSFNSIIAATNNVYIADKGCFNSKITAGGNIYINGIIRGGEVNAKGNILVKEAGSETGSKTILQTSSGKIKIFNKIYDGVVVYINNRLLKITGTMGPVIFSNDDGEQVQIKYL